MPRWRFRLAREVAEGAAYDASAFAQLVHLARQRNAPALGSFVALGEWVLKRGH